MMGKLSVRLDGFVQAYQKKLHILIEYLKIQKNVL